MLLLLVLMTEKCDFIQIYMGIGYHFLITKKTGAHLFSLLCLALGTMMCAEVISGF